MFSSSFAALALAFVLIVVLPFTGTLERRLLWSDRRTGRKLIAYGVMIIVLWSLTAGAVWLNGWPPLLESRTSAAAWLPAAKFSIPVLSFVVAIYMITALLPFLRSVGSESYRRKYANLFRRHAEACPALLPEAGIERVAFLLVSVTAGICEEVLFRGFLIQFLAYGPLALPLAVALFAASLSFGLGHIYQGTKGVIGTAVGGFVFGLLFLLCGNLWPGIILHALIDAQVVWVLMPFREDLSVSEIGA